MRLKPEQLEFILNQLSFSEDILKDLYEKYNGDTSKILKEYFNADTKVVLNEVKTKVTRLTTKYIAYENRKHKTIDFPEISIWDEYREFLIDILNIKSYMELKDIIADLMLEISLFILDNNEYYLPNRLGKIKFNKPLQQKNKSHNHNFLVKNRITRLSYANFIINNKYKLIPRDRLKLLTIMDYLNNRKFETC